MRAERYALAVLLLAVSARVDTFAGKTVAEALTSLQRRGLHIIYSSALVQPAMVIANEPIATDLRGIAVEILVPFDLTLGDAGGQLIVVRAEPKQVKPPLFLKQIIVTPSHTRHLGRVAHALALLAVLDDPRGTLGDRELLQMLVDQFIFRTVFGIVAENPNLAAHPSHLYVWMSDNYVERIAMAVRRMRDPRRKTITNLLRRMNANPSLVSRAHYHAMVQPSTPGPRTAEGGLVGHRNADARSAVRHFGWSWNGRADHRANGAGDHVARDIRRTRRVVRNETRRASR